jgi:hypothetical protein
MWDAPVATGAASRAKKKGTDNEEMKMKAPRTNWGVGRAKERMESGVANWLGKTGNTLDDNDKEYPLKQFSCVVNIPYDTLKKYVTEDETKRRSLGKSVGRASLLKHSDQHFLADVLARRDRGNDRADPKEAIDMVQELAPGLNRTQARCHWQRMLLLNFPQQLKQKSVVALGNHDS